jgi:hypothetical protein
MPFWTTAQKGSSPPWVTRRKYIPSAGPFAMAWPDSKTEKARKATQVKANTKNLDRFMMLLLSKGYP